MRAKEFLFDDDKSSSKLNFIKSKIDSGEVTDAKTIDYIYKILQTPEIKNTINVSLGKVSERDQDVAAFQNKNNQALADIIRKLPVEKEALDQFVHDWASGKGFVNVALLTPGNRGTLQDLIPDPTALIAFQTFEKVRSQYSLPKKGSAGYGEFGLSMLSPFINLKAPGDIQISGSPIEVKGNDSRLYSDERAGMVEDQTTEPKNNTTPRVKQKRGTAPGALNNVLTGILNNDQNTIDQAVQSFASRGRTDANQIIKDVQQQGPSGLKTLAVEWWKSGFNSYQSAIKMPILILGFNQFLISDKAEDFIQWGCLPKSITFYGYMFGRKAGQNRETYPKIFVPGHNK
jgi:hypothetical protein